MTQYLQQQEWSVRKSVCMYVWRRTLIMTRYLQQQEWSEKVYVCMSEGEHSLWHGIFNSRNGVKTCMYICLKENTRYDIVSSAAEHSYCETRWPYLPPNILLSQQYLWLRLYIPEMPVTEYRSYSANFIQCLHKLHWAYSEVSHWLCALNLYRIQKERRSSPRLQ
jgi:hypothetical protein